MRDVAQALLRAHEEGRLHHSYVFSGPAGVGKLEAVENFATAIFSQGAMFSNPDATRARIQAKNHPDYFLVEPEEEVISVDAVREAMRQIIYAPLEAPLRIVVIRNAHCMNAQAANVLLKTLEEPPPHTKFILTTTEDQLLLQTVRSRSQIVRFPPLAAKKLQSELGAEGRDLVHWAEGSIFRAKEILENPERASLRDEAAQLLLAQWELQPRIPHDILSFVEGVSEESDVALVLDSWLALVRDFALVWEIGGGDPGVPLHHPALRTRLAELSRKVTDQASVDEVRAELAEQCAAIHRFRVFRERNGNLRTGWDLLVPSLQLFSSKKIQGTP